MFGIGPLDLLITNASFRGLLLVNRQAGGLPLRFEERPLGSLDALQSPPHRIRFAAECFERGGGPKIVPRLVGAT